MDTEVDNNLGMPREANSIKYSEGERQREQNRRRVHKMVDGGGVRLEENETQLCEELRMSGKERAGV